MVRLQARQVVDTSTTGGRGLDHRTLNVSEDALTRLTDPPDERSSDSKCHDAGFLRRQPRALFVRSHCPLLSLWNRPNTVSALVAQTRNQKLKNINEKNKQANKQTNNNKTTTTKHPKPRGLWFERGSGRVDKESCSTLRKQGEL